MQSQGRSVIGGLPGNFPCSAPRCPARLNRTLRDPVLHLLLADALAATRSRAEVEELA